MPEQDTLWEVFNFPKDFEKFSKLVTVDFNLNPHLQPDTTRHFRIVRRLLELSYFEWEFYDMALERCLFLFEKVLRIRYKEITGSALSDDRFVKLLEWFRSNGYFEVDDEEFLNTIRELRNRFAHPDDFHIGGRMYNHWITHVIDLINDTYECPELRAVRFSKCDAWQTQLQKMCEQGAVYKTPDGTIPLFYAHIGFMDNRKTPAAIEFSLIKRIDIPADFHENPGAYNYDVLDILCSDIMTGDGYLLLLDEQSREIGRIEQQSAQEQKVYIDLLLDIDQTKSIVLYKYLLFQHCHAKYIKARQHFHRDGWTIVAADLA